MTQNEALFIHNLKTAIIFRAVEDYTTALKDKKLGKKWTWYDGAKIPVEYAIRENERFFRSNWFTLLTDINGEMIIKTIKEKVGVNDEGCIG